MGKRLDIQTIEQRPSIGKFDAAAAALEPQARDSLFSTSASRNKPTSPRIPEEAPHPLSAAAMRLPAYPQSPSYPATENPWADTPASGHDIDVQAAAARAMERPQFDIDDVGDGDEGDEEDGGDDAGLVDQVDQFLADDEGLTDKAAWAGQGEFLPLGFLLDLIDPCACRIAREGRWEGPLLGFVLIDTVDILCPLSRSALSSSRSQRSGLTSFLEGD